MADNRTHEPRHPVDTDQKADDPLAELARIVGFDNEQTDASAQNATSSDTQSGFDLEAELMRELQINVDDGPGKVVAPVQPDAEYTPQPLQMAASHPVNEPAPVDDLPVEDMKDTDGAWPHAVQDRAQQMNSLEAELQAAFSALEGKRPEPAPAAEPPTEPVQAVPEEVEVDAFAQAAEQLQTELAAEPVSVSEPDPIEPTPEPLQHEVAAVVAPAPAEQLGQPFAEAAPVEEPVLADSAPQMEQPVAVGETIYAPEETQETAEALKESDELKEAYDRLQRDIEAAKPQEVELGDSEDQLTEMLLAEMADVESEAAASMPVTEDMPFDPSDISESENVPEAMAEVEVPDYQDEPDVELNLRDEDFGLSLEDELDGLASPEPLEQQPTPRRGESVQALPTDNAAANHGAPLAASMQGQYDDDPGMEGYSDEFDDDVFPGDEDFVPEDLVAPAYSGMENANRGSGRKGLVAAIVVLGVAALGGGGFYVWNGGLGGDGLAGGPMIIAADNDPVKVKPEDPGGKTVPNEDLAVYDRVAGNDSTGGDDQQLVSTTEEPVDIVQRTLSSDTLPLEGRTEIDPAALKIEERLGETEALDPDPAATSGTAGVAPRKVRTLVVRPDGTIVAREDPADDTSVGATGTIPTNAQDSGLASETNPTVLSDDTVRLAEPSAAESTETASTGGTLPVVIAEPISGGETNAGPIDASETAAEAGALPPIDENLRNTGATPLPQAKPVQVASVQADTQSRTDAGGGQTNAAVAQTGNTPIPTTRPAEQPVNIVEAVTERGNLAGTSQASNNPGGYMMQISSQPSEEAARASYENLSQQYGSILGGRGFDIQRADIENRGVFYRVRIPAGDREAANALCAEYKAAGGSCFVAR